MTAGESELWQGRLIGGRLYLILPPTWRPPAVLDVSSPDAESAFGVGHGSRMLVAANQADVSGVAKE